MAHLTDRGQVILVAAFALAVTFLALALVINSAIFTENLATRGETTSGSDALLYRHEVETNLANVTESVNENRSTDIVEEVNRSVVNLSLQGGFQNARQGRVVTVDLQEDSTLVLADIDNNDSSEYTNATGETEWTLANDTERIRSAQFNVSAVSTDNESLAYRLSIDDAGSSDRWNMTVFEDGALGSQVNITVRNESTRLSSCTDVSVTDIPFTINLTAGQAEDTTLGLPVCTDTLSDENRTYTDYSTKNITFREGNNVSGNYSIRLENGDLKTENFNDTSPVAEAWIERLDVRYTYETDQLYYNTTVSVRPGEDDD